MTDGPPIGHVKLSRKTFESDPWWLEARAFSRWEAWVYLIQLAAWKRGAFVTQSDVVVLERGEFVASRRHLAKVWSWTEKKVRHWLATAQNGARIRAQRETKAGTVYLIVNYDLYQNNPRPEGRVKGPAKGPAGAQQGPKIEAVEAVEALHLSVSGEPDALVVLDHYRATHPQKRGAKSDLPTIRKALTIGYSAAELCDAIDGNAADDWHRERAKHELSYVLRNAELIDRFRALVEVTKPRLAVDPATGLPNAAGLAIIAGSGR